jgi:DNA/RNA-binding domain of Phe-tRNA-synthetase-like protein
VTAIFDYDPALLGRFATIRAGMIHAAGLRSEAAPATLATTFHAEQVAALDRLGSMSPAEIPAVAAWRRVFREFGVKPTQYRSAIEALLRRLTKKGDIPAISTLVDVGNLVSIRYAVPVAFFDLASVAGKITVRFADGSEDFADLGSSATVHPEPGEVIFVDEAGVVAARRWCWRQSAQSATGPDTSEVLVTVEGHHDAAAGDVTAAVADIRQLLAQYQPTAHITQVAVFAPQTGWQAL